MMTTPPVTIGQSRSWMALYICRPTPGQLKTVSVRMVPAHHGPQVEAQKGDHWDHGVLQAVPPDDLAARQALWPPRYACSPAP